MTGAIVKPLAAQALPKGDSPADANALVIPVGQLAGGSVDLAASVLPPMKIQLTARSIELATKEARQ